jgi:hypothetical protein
MVGFGLYYGYPPELTGYQAFIWNRGDAAFTLLGTVSGSPNDISYGRFISDTGVIVGNSGPSSINQYGMIWTVEQGMMDLEQYLVDQGVTEITSSINLVWPRAFSKNGNVLIGEYVDLYGGWGYYRVIFDETVGASAPPVPTVRLTGIHPNPFNPQTTVAFALERAQRGSVSIYDLAGERIAVLADGLLEAGDHALVWRGLDEAGRRVASGTYMVRLECEEGRDLEPVTLVK